MEATPSAQQDAPTGPAEAAPRMRYRCPRCGRSLAPQATQCENCRRPVKPALLLYGDWRTDNSLVRYGLLCVGTEYVTALGLLTLAAILIDGATSGGLGMRLPLALAIAWFGLPVVLVAGEMLRGAWSMEFLPGFLYPISFVSFVAGAVAAGFGKLAGVAGGAPILFTIIAGWSLGRLWMHWRPFESVYRAMLANTLSVAITFVPMLGIAFAVLKLARQV